MSSKGGAAAADSVGTSSSSAAAPAEAAVAAAATATATAASASSASPPRTAHLAATAPIRETHSRLAHATGDVLKSESSFFRYARAFDKDRSGLIKLVSVNKILQNGIGLTRKDATRLLSTPWARSCTEGEMLRWVCEQMGEGGRSRTEEWRAKQGGAERFRVVPGKQNGVA